MECVQVGFESGEKEEEGEKSREKGNGKVRERAGEHKTYEIREKRRVYVPNAYLVAGLRSWRNR